MISPKLYQWLLITLLFSFCAASFMPVQAHDEGGTPLNPSPYSPGNKNKDKKKECEDSVGSTASFCAGNLSTDYVLPSYRALGLSRSLWVVYNSTSADVRPIISANVDPTGRLRPATLSASLSVGGRPMGNEIFYNAAAFSAPSRIAVQFDANDLATGLYPYRMRLGYNYASSTIFESFSDQVLVNSQRNSPFGVGWTLEGLQRLVFDGNSTILVEGDGSAKVFPRNLVSSLFVGTVDSEVGSNPRSVAVGDFNGDGNPDLAVANWNSNNVSILLGNGDGSFQPARNFGAGNLPWSVAVGDFNGDGNPDLAVANRISNNVSILLGNGDGSFQTARNFGAGRNLWSVAVGDFNGDGKPDLAVTNTGSNNVSLLLGNGDGSFQPAVDFRAGIWPSYLAVGDFNEDGKPDLAVASHGVAPGDAMVLLLLSPRRSPLGEYSELASNKNGTYTRRMKDGTQVNFDADGKTTSITDRNEHRTEYRYDDSGRVERIIDPVGKITRFQYAASAECQPEAGRGFCVVDPVGRVTTFNLDASSDLKSIKDPMGATVEYGYDSNHRMTSQKDRRGQTTRYEYNFAGRFSRSRRMLRDEEDRLVEVTNGVAAVQMVGLVDSSLGLGTRQNPAPMRSLSDVQSSFTDSRGNITTRTTGRFGEETLARDALGRETRILRDGNGNATRIISANGAETLMSYDKQGNLIRSVTSPDNRARYVSEFTYHPEFNEILSKKDAKGNVTQFEYDDVQPCGTSNRGNLCKVIDPLGNVTELIYDSRGLLTETRTRADGRNLAARSQYYPDGNLWKDIDPLGRVTERTYDMAGNVRTLKDAEGRMTVFEDDAMNRVTRTIDALAGETLYRYEPGCCGGSSGRLAELQDARGKITRFRYDEAGRLREVENPLGQIRKFRYDQAGNPVRFINTRNQEIKFTYDLANQPASKEVPGDGITCYSYDRVGNLASVKKFARVCTEPVPKNGLEFAYDLLNRTVRLSTLANSDGQPVRTITYGYDENSRRIQMQHQGEFTNYEYDKLTRLVSLINPAKQETRFEYDEIGRRKRMTLPNQVVADYQYDEADQLRRLTYTGKAGELARFDYAEYDGVGNRRVIRESPGDIVHQYDYDGRYRLQGATHAGQPMNPPESYTYDRAGNRLGSHLRQGGSCFDDANRIVHDGQYGYEYDGEL